MPVTPPGSIGTWSPTYLTKFLNDWLRRNPLPAQDQLTIKKLTVTSKSTAPTQNLGDSSTNVATTAFVQGLISSISSGVLSFNGRTGTVVPASGDYSVGQVTGAAPLASPTFTGTPAAPTPATADNTTKIATTAFVKAQGYVTSTTAPVTSVFGRTGAVVKASGDYAVADVTGAAPIASPTFTGVPAAPTAAVDTNTTQLATTAFVLGQASAVGDGTPAMDGTAARGTSTHFARADHVHPTDTSRAPLASPTFTGTPAAPTPATADNSTTVATTAFVKAQGYLTSNAVSSVFGRTGAVVATTGDYSVSQVTGAAPTASPIFTGFPTAPTQNPLDNSTNIATTAYVDAAVASGGTGIGTLLTYDQATSFVAATTTGATLITGTAHTYSGTQFVDIEFFGTVITPSVAGSTVSVILMDGATQVAFLAVVKTPAAANMEIPIYTMWRAIPTAGSHQYGIKVTASTITGTPQVGGGSGTVPSGFTPAFLRVRQAS